MWEALFQQGTVAFDAGDLPTAVKKLEAALALSPSAPAYTMLGATYARMGDTQKATAALNEALRIDPEFALARQLLVSP